MDHASDVGGRVKKLLEEYTGRTAKIEYMVRDGIVNVLDIWQDDGTSFIITIVKVR
jgi:hypothetical protein